MTEALGMETIGATHIQDIFEAEIGKKVPNVIVHIDDDSSGA